MTESSSGGGAATQGGINFQNRVAAWVCTQMLAGRPAAPVGPPAVPIYVRFETREPVDDILIGTTDLRHSFVQAKRTISLSSSQDSELASVINQFVGQYLKDSPAECPWQRKLDPARDRLVLVTSSYASERVRRHLKGVLERARDLVPGQPISDTAINQDDQRALTSVTEHIRRSWKNLRNLEPSETDLVALLKLTHVAVLDVESGDTDEREALAQLSDHVARISTQAGAAWSRIVQFVAELSQRRSGTDESALRAELETAGIALKATLRFEEDISRIETYTRNTIDQSAHYSRISTGALSIRVDRGVVSTLRSVLEANSVIVVGVPGAGKSGVLHDLAESLVNAGTDVLYMAVDHIGARSLAELRIELGLEHDIIEVIRNWPGEQAGIVVIDALDAARGEPSTVALLSLMRAIIEMTGRWHVVVSIRKYDLRYSNELQALFHGTLANDADPTYQDDEFHQLKHINVPLFSLDDLATIRSQAPNLDLLLRTAPEALNELVRVPFNLSLLVDIAETGGDLLTLKPVGTQAELLKRYWRHRVISNAGGNLRERLLRKCCDVMIQTRRLRAERQSVIEAGTGEALEVLLSGQVLIEWQPPAAKTPVRRLVAFSHHILFDFAVSQLALPADSEGVIAKLSGDPDLLLMIRPSIEFYFDQLWSDNREEFWKLVLEICRSERIPQIGKVIGPGVIAHRARTMADLKPIVDSISSQTPELRTTGEAVFGHLIGTLIAGHQSILAEANADLWCSFLRTVTTS
jgi:signal recognition particle GTPase